MTICTANHANIPRGHDAPDQRLIIVRGREDVQLDGPRRTMSG